MKLANFGIRHVRKSNHEICRLKNTSGASKSWVPLEWHKTDCFTMEMDLFALGLIFGFSLWKGRHIFGRNKERRVLRILYQKSMKLVLEDLQDVPNGEEAFSLIQTLVNANPAARPTTSTVLEHSYFTNSAAGNADIDQSYVTFGNEPPGNRFFNLRQVLS